MRALKNRRVPDASVYVEIFQRVKIGVAVFLLEEPADPATYRLAAVNAAGARLLGLDVSGPGRRLSELPAPLDLELAGRLSAVRASGRPLRLDRLPLEDGRVFEMRLFRLPDDYVGALLEEVTRREKTSRALHDSIEMFRHMVEAVQDYAIFRLDALGRVATWNSGAEKIKGYRACEILGQSFSIFFEPKERAAGTPERLLAEARERGRIEDESWRLRRDGSSFFAHATITAIRGPDGRLEGYVKVVRDVTERLRARDELESKNRELEGSNSELAQFASVASHDLREPLNKVAAFADLLERRLDGRLDRDSADCLRRLTSSVASMNRLINDLLAWSRVSTRDAALAEVDLRAPLAEALADLEDAVARSKARVDVGPLPRLRADPGQMRQLFANLIGNAIKFAKKNEPPVIIVRGHARGDGFCEISVSDNGIGFEPQYAQQILKPFQRLHSRAEYDGTGMGLAICDKIALRHGGEIKAFGDPGKGATFVVILPTPY